MSFDLREIIMEVLDFMKGGRRTVFKVDKGIPRLILGIVDTVHEENLSALSGARIGENGKIMGQP